MKDEKKLYSPAYLREILGSFGFSFTKSLGQNFLIDGNIVRAIVDRSDIASGDRVLEIGPGVGSLTQELATKADRVLAIEIDRGLRELLSYTLTGYDNVDVVFEDVLKANLEGLIDEYLGGGPVKVVANLPYYITTPIIGRLLEEDLNLESITVMVQKEVANRIVAQAGSKDYSALSVFIDFYTEPEIVLEVPRTVFMPQPNVDSAVVRLKLKEPRTDIKREDFFKVVKASFAMRRKTLLNCLSKGDFQMDKEEIKELLEGLNIDPRIRGERLELEEFVEISKVIR